MYVYMYIMVPSPPFEVLGGPQRGHGVIVAGFPQGEILGHVFLGQRVPVCSVCRAPSVQVELQPSVASHSCQHRGHQQQVHT